MAAYNGLHLLGCLAAMAIFTTGLRRHRLPWIHGLVLPLLLLVVARFSARFFFALESGQWASDWRWYFSFGPGASSQYAGFLPSLLLVFAYGYLAGIPALLLYDLAAPAFSLAVAFGRAGCLAAGCCAGRTLPPGWRLPAWFPAPGHFPAQVGEGLAAILLTLFLLGIPTTDRDRGRRAGWFLVLHGCTRFLGQFVRVDTIYWGPLTSTQVISLAVIASGALLLTLRPGRVNVSPPAWSA
jgi:phosphatidylglycerol:prolipoprotein diacylglycerol transferase